MTNKTSEAQIRATRKWESKNRKKTTIQSYKRSGRLFIREYASEEDLQELEELIAKRRKAIEEGA